MYRNRTERRCILALWLTRAKQPATFGSVKQKNKTIQGKNIATAGPLFSIAHCTAILSLFVICNKHCKLITIKMKVSIWLVHEDRRDRRLLRPSSSPHVMHTLHLYDYTFVGACPPLHSSMCVCFLPLLNAKSPRLNHSLVRVKQTQAKR